jgi:hypothetical protein
MGPIQRPTERSTLVIIDVFGRDDVQRHHHILLHSLLQDDTPVERIDSLVALTFRLLADQKYLTSYISNDNLSEDLLKSKPKGCLK